MKTGFKTFLICIVILFAGVGVLFSGVFLAQQWGLLNVRGSIEERNSFFQNLAPRETDTTRNTILCKIRVLSGYSPLSASTFLDVYGQTGDGELLTTMLTVGARRFERTDILREYERCTSASQYIPTESVITAFAWSETPEWSTLKGAFPKDVEVINRVALETGVPARLIVASAVPEQLRFFNSNRESYKRYFEPLKLLGTLSQFSLGVTGIKPETAERVEEYANDPASPYYPGEGMAVLVGYGPEDKHDEVLYERLTDPDDHYYQYLYTALYLKEIMRAWETAGFPIDDNPGVLVTLFNLGFNKSVPKENPETGGAPVTVGDTVYTFGQLGEEFYYSGELVDLFVYPTR